MSGVEQDPTAHLVSLIEVAPDPRQQDRILTLAADGEVRLYVPKSPGLDVYVASSKHHLYYGITRLLEERVDETQLGSSPTPTNPVLSSEIQYLALVPLDALRLLNGWLAIVEWFDGGLKVTRSDAMHPHGRLEYVAARFFFGREGAILNDDGTPWFGLQVNRRDVLLDRRMLGLTVDSNANSAPSVATSAIDTRAGAISYQPEPRLSLDESIKEKPLASPSLAMQEVEDAFQLQSRAPGAFVLYSAAKHFFGPNHADTASQRAVANWIKNPSVQIRDWISTLPGDYEKLANEANSRLANKLITPEYKDPKSRDPRIQPKPLSGDALGQAWKYRDGAPHISERFSLVLLAVGFWQQLLCDDTAYTAGSIPVARLLKYVNMLFTEVAKYGFTSKEEMRAIVNFVIWPHYIPELEKLKAASQAPRRSAKKGR